MVVVAVAAVVALAGCDWAQFGFGPDQTSYNPSEPALTTTSVAHLATSWTAPCVCRTPALVAGGLVYFSGQSPTASLTFTIEARDELTGEQRWATTFQNVHDVRFIGVGNGLAYVRIGSLPLDGAINTSEVVLALDATTGKARWFMVPPAPVDGLVSLPAWVLDGPRLFAVTTVPGAGYMVSAIDTAGRVIWAKSATGTVEGIVADPGRDVHVVSFVKTNPNGSGVDVLTTYNEATGNVDAARFADFGPLGLEFPQPLSFANGLVYAASNGNTLQGNHVKAVAVAVASGVQAWSALDEIVSVVTPNAAVTLGNGVVARNPTTGTVLWSNPSSVLVGDGQYGAATGGIVFANQGGLRAFRLSDGAVLSTTPGGGQITLADGRVVVAGATTLQVLTPTG
jgi:hypothetical protein